MNFIQEVLSLLERKQDKKTLDLKRDWFEFGRTKPSSVGNPLYSPKMTPHAIRYNDLKCNIISGLVQGTGTEHTLPMWSTVDPTNCGVQTMIDSIFSQDAGATEGKVSGDFRVTGNTVLEGDLLVLGTQTIVESTIVQVADNIMRINSAGAALDAGIEVIQPSGTKTWAWDNTQGMWSTFGDNIRTEDIFINGAIHQDGESLVNVVNEAEGLASQDNDNSLATVAAIIDWTDKERDYISNVSLSGTDLTFTGVNNAFSGVVDLSGLSGGGGSGTGVNGIDKAEYEVIYTTDVNLIQAGPGQLVFNTATDEIYMSWHDLNNNDRRYALETILYSPGKKPFGLFTADKADPWVNYNAQYFNPCGIEILGINCLPWDGTTPNLNPTQGTTGDDGGNGIPIDIVWSSSSAGIKQGGQGAVYATVYVHPDVIGETIQTPVMSGSGLSFANEPIDDPKALATAFSNPGYVTFNPPINNAFTIYLNSSMTTIAGGGYYMERSEFDNLSSGSFGYISNWDDALQSWDKDIVSFKNPAATQATGNPELICTVNSRSLAVSITGVDQFVIPWIQGQQKGTGWAPQNEKAIVTLDMAGKEECLVDANGNAIGGETVTDVAYDKDQNILGHVDEEGVISLMPLVGAQLEPGTLIDITNGVISHAQPTFTGSMVSSSINLNYGQTITQQLVVGQDPNNPLLQLQSDGYGHITGINYRALSMPDWLGLTNVVLNGTDLEFTNTAGLFGGFSGSVDLSSLLNGTNVIANPGNPTTDLTSISIDGISYGIASTAADGNDFIDSVTLTGSDLIFTGSGGAFSGTIDLSGLSGTTYTASNGIELVNPTEFGLIDVARTNSSTAESPAHTGTFTVIDDITTNTKGQVTGVNVKTITLPASGTGADGVITNVALTGTDLVFTGSNGGFNGTVSLSTLGADGNATYTLGLVAGGVNDTVVKLTGANGGADSQFTLAGGTGISITENTNTNTIVIASTVTDTNDIDYISNVALSGSNLDFTGIGNGFNGSIDLSSLSTTVETLTSLSINANTLTYTDENGVDTDIDLSLYLDDTNLARLVSGTLDGSTGIATFSRDDASTFTVDFSSLIDVDTNDIDYVTQVALNGDSLDFTGIGNAFTGSIDLSGYANAAETVTSLSFNANTLTYTDENGANTDIDLSLYLDDTDTTYSFDVPNSGSVAAITLQGSDGSTDVFRILPGNDIAISTSGGDIRIDSTASGATYTAGTGLTLNGSTFDANVNPVVQVEASNPVTAIKSRVYDVQVNSSDELVVNVPWIDTQYSAGTYLNLSGSQFNHDNTALTPTTSTASPAAGGTFTAIDSVTTNATGHVTGINTKTIRLPEGGGSTCVTGMWYSSDQTGNQFLTNAFSAIGNPTLGFRNTDAVTKHYAISWTIQYAVLGTAGARFFETQMVAEVGGVPLIIPESKWADSGYMVSEYSTTRTYTLYTNLGPNDVIYPQVKGSSDVFIKKAHIQVVETACESTNNGSIEVIQGRS